MQIEEGFVLSKNKQEIYTRTWNPPKSTRIIATVTFVHGLGENCCRYDHVFSVFADAGIKVASFDQRGFGQTGRRDGVLGHNEGLKTVLEDISECSNRVRLPNVPHFLFGHSMGGFLVLRYVSTNSSDIAGVIASAPLIGLGSAAVLPFPFMEIQRFAVINLSYLLPNFTILNPVKSRDLSRDPKVCAEYDLDPHNHPYVSFGTINDVVIGGEKLVPSDVKIPILVSHGSCDNLTSCDASKKFVDECSVADKEHWLLDGYYHELHNDLGNDLVIDKYVNWILQRAKK